MDKKQPDLGCDLESVVLLEAEIDTLMHRLAELDPNAVFRIEKMLARLRVERAVEVYFN